MSTDVLAVIVVIWIICACAAASVAANKGLSAGGYFLLGFLLGLVGLAIALIAQPRPANLPGLAARAGWYSDPWCVAALRYFDGHQWTGHVHDS